MKLKFDWLKSNWRKPNWRKPEWLKFNLRKPDWIKSDWQKPIRKSVTYVLVAVVASAITVAALGEQDIKMTELQNIIDWKFAGQASMEKTREDLEASRKELEENAAQLEAAKAETEKLLEQLHATNKDLAELLEQAKREEGMVDEKIDELLGAYKDAAEKDRQKWVMPIQYTKCTSEFGYRLHPIEGENKFHYGVDLSAPYGTPIVASRSGTVTKAAYEADGAGNYVNIDHLDGYSTRYMHMARYIVNEGQFVMAGQVIGYCGSTGASTGSHLHFSIYYNGGAVDPAKFLDIT